MTPAPKGERHTPPPETEGKEVEPPKAPAKAAAITVGFAEGVTDGKASTGPPGVRLSVSVPLDTLTAINWGDTIDAPPDISGDFVAHIYGQPATDMAVTVTDTSGASGTSESFELVPPEPANPPTDSHQEAVEVGYWGQPPDPNPNDTYTVEGVTP
jgi:hypothetical protein